MLSLAPPGGSVGPHFDYYDVFLLQGRGKRRWQLGPRCDGDTPTLSGTPLSILKTFEAQQEWMLESGDMLYIPPGFAHWGIAMEESITLSIGFRAPANHEFVAAVADAAQQTRRADQRYTDPDLTAIAHPGEIPEEAVDRLQQVLLDLASDRALLVDCFGTLITEVKYERR